MLKQIHSLPFESIPKVPRGNGIVNHLIASKKVGAINLHSGITELPPGATVPRHTHNAEEQVTVLKGRLRINMEDRSVECGPFDSTFITAGVSHDFNNISDETSFVMVIYGSAEVNRTFSDTGETVEIGSERDRFPAPSP